MNKYFLALTFSLLVCKATPFELLKETEVAYSHIAYLCDQEGNNYILKQIKEPEIDQQFLLVLDCLGVFIAQQIGIAINSIQLLAPDVDHVGKQVAHTPATLHSLAPGIQLSEPTGKFADLDIQQRCRPKDSWYWKRFGPLPVEKQGLSKTVIGHMARHPQLPALVALDTFTGNRDRSRLNLFYDESTDSFCAIDMGEAYKYNLCKEAICQLLRLRNQGYIFSPEERNALREYRDTLKTLIATYPPELVCQKLTEFADQAGFRLKRNRKFAQCMKFYQHMIQESYLDAQILVDVLAPWL